MLAEGGRIERLRLCEPWYSRPVAHHGRRLPLLAESSRVERPPLRGSGFPHPVGIHIPVLSELNGRGRRSRNPHPEGAPVLETGGGPSARGRGGAPGENRTHHELLCRQPLCW